MPPWILIASMTLAAGETVTVTTLEDTTDFGGGQTVADLPGPDGAVSFREAITAANNTPGGQTVAFAIPAAEWWLLDDIALLRQEGGTFAITDDDTTVDFSTQTDFTGDTNPDGFEVGVYGLQPNGWGSPAISISADGCTVRGLDRVLQRGYGVSISGNGNRVVGCTISGPLYAGVEINGFFNGPPATGNIVGGTEPGDGNVLSAGNSGVRIDGPAADNVVIGNTLSGSYAGVEVRSAACCPGNDATGTRIGGPTEAERNVIANAGHYGEEGYPVGAQVTIEYADDTIVEGNYIGTTPHGNASAIQTAPVGIRVLNADGAIIRNNLVSGIFVDGINHADGERFGTGIAITGDCAGTVIEGNLVGTDATGNAAVPNHAGISIGIWPPSLSPTDTSIAGNTIAFNELFGIGVASGVNGVTISGNSIFANDELGIELFGGANDGQAAPTPTSAEVAGATLTVTGTASGTPNRTLVLEFFANTTCDTSGAGEGRVFLGAATTVAGPDGNASFTVDLEGPAAPGDVITATATDGATGSTSAFSNCIIATGDDAMPGDVTGDDWVGVDDLVALFEAWGVCPAPDNCPADLDGNGVVNIDDLVMCILNWS